MLKLGWLGITQGCRQHNHSIKCTWLLFEIIRNYASILYRFWVTSHLLKVANIICLSVHALKGKRLELSTPKSARGRPPHVLTLRWKGQGHVVIKRSAGVGLQVATTACVFELHDTVVAGCVTAHPQLVMCQFKRLSSRGGSSASPPLFGSGAMGLQKGGNIKMLVVCSNVEFFS